MIDKNKIISMISMFAVGGLIGAGVALLMAPQSGQKTRSLIRDKSMELKDKAVGTVEDTRSRAESTLNDITSQTKDRVSSLTQKGKDKIQGQSEKMKDTAKESMHL